MRKFQFAIFSMFLCLCWAPFQLQAQDLLMPHSIGAIVKTDKIQGGIRFTTSDQHIVWITTYSPTIIRVRVTDQKPALDESYAVIGQVKPAFTAIRENATGWILQTDSLEVHVQKKPLRIEFYHRDGTYLDGDDPQLGITWQGSQVYSYRKLLDPEKFIGLGEKTGPLNRRGLSYVNWNTDAGYQTYSDPLYATYPFYIGILPSHVFGLFFDNTFKSFFNFGGSTDDRMYFFGAEGGEMNYYFFGASTVAAILQDYTALTGRMPMPPLWSLGYQQCRYSYMSQQQLLDVARRFRQDSLPCDVIYCDIDYMRGYRVFTWNPETYPDPKSMTDTLKKLGMHLVTIIDPGIKIDSNGYEPYLSGLAHGYFARYPDGKPYTGSVWAGRSHFPDFTREDVRQWWGQQFQVLVNSGVTGFWNDMNEPAAWGQNIPPVVEFGTGDHVATIQQVHNVYGMQMARATYEGTRKWLNGMRPFVLTRAAYSGVQRYSAEWTGDNFATDDNMIMGYRTLNSMGLSGESFVGMDIGGFNGNPSPELYVRWMSLGIYTPLFRNHTAKGNTSHEPWAWGEFNEATVRRFLQTRYRLLPYLYSCFYVSHTTGMPVNRSLAIDYTYDEHIYDPRFDAQFLFGPFMLVAPVVSTQQACEVYLPHGQWYRFSTDQLYAGDTSWWVPAPLDDLPVFVKAGAIIPMQNAVESTAEPGDGILRIHVWYGPDSTSFTYYEDDGQTYQYEQGQYLVRQLKFSPKTHRFEIGPATGSYISRFKQIEWVGHHFPADAQFTVNGKPVTVKHLPNDLTILTLPVTTGSATIQWEP
ncbi:MAG: glycoside hydrolase family 31 protein [Thermoflavifilum aggregans]|nr:glycoside hydrolase family 31 protein [Thermoflavifilum aggregans]